MASSKSKLSEFGGLKVENIDEITPKFICEFCGLLLLSPWQLLCCGMLACKWCLRKGLSNSEPFTCPVCHVKQKKKEALFDRGTERELKAIIVACYSCNWKGSYDDYLKHLQEQHANFECPDCHERFFAINLIEEHRQELCHERSISCGLSDCINSIKWYDMQSHYLSINHQKRIILFISEYIHSNRRQIHDESRIREYQDIGESISITFSTYDILTNDYRRLQVDMSPIRTNFELIVSKKENLKKQEKDNEKNLQELTEKNNGTEHLLNNINKTREENKILILDTNSSTILRFNLPIISSFSIHSSKFKTSQYGYIFMVRLCSTIEHDGEEYLSIFLSLFNGEYNNLIPFPFSYDIHFILWDQSNQQKHIGCVLKPDLTSSACTRPINEKNDEYGISKFCPLRYLTDPESIYVKDGVFFIRIFIDFLNTKQNPFQLNDNNHETELMATTTTMITD